MELLLGGKDRFLKQLKSAAEHGDGDAASQLGTMYYSGHQVIQNLDEAEYWFRLAAENGAFYMPLMLYEALQ